MSEIIIVFKESTTPKEIEQCVKQIEGNGGVIGHQYDPVVLKGFSATIPQDYLPVLQSMASLLDPNSPIDYIESDGVVTTQQ